VENIHSSRLAPPCSPETWPCIFRHLPQDHWDRRQLRLPLFFLFVENSCGLQIFTQHKSRFHHSPLPWVSMSILGIPMGIQCVSWVSFPLPSPHSWRSAPRAPGARRS
jgi:hypothetical protein